MGVVINNFDVTAENPQEQASTGTQSAVSQAETALTPQEAWDLFQRQTERMTRLRAE